MNHTWRWQEPILFLSVLEPLQCFKVLHYSIQFKC